jgi:RNA polymerase sigma-70 factor (ECF subfamily)
MNEIADNQLISQYKNGDENALSQLIIRYQKELFSFIYYKILDDDLANDIFQDTFMKAIIVIKEGKYNDEGKFVVWIKRIAHNLIIDHFRKEKNENTFSADSVDYDVVNNNTKLSEKSVEDVMTNEQILSDVVRLIDFLPASQQSVVRMRFFEDLSFKEIAEKTDVSINTALGRMRYALLNMRRIAQEKDVYLEMK